MSNVNANNVRQIHKMREKFDAEHARNYQKMPENGKRYYKMPENAGIS